MATFSCIGINRTLRERRKERRRDGCQKKIESQLFFIYLKLSILDLHSQHGPGLDLQKRGGGCFLIFAGPSKCPFFLIFVSFITHLNSTPPKKVLSHSSLLWSLGLDLRGPQIRHRETTTRACGRAAKLVKRNSLWSVPLHGSLVLRRVYAADLNESASVGRGGTPVIVRVSAGFLRSAAAASCTLPALQLAGLVAAIATPADVEILGAKGTENSDCWHTNMVRCGWSHQLSSCTLVVQGRFCEGCVHCEPTHDCFSATLVGGRRRHFRAPEFRVYHQINSCAGRDGRQHGRTWRSI